MNHDVFISYSGKDKEITETVCRLLEQNGVKCWMAPRDVQTGVDYATLIDNAIIHCRVFVLIFSQYSAHSKWVSGEVNVAFNENKSFFPLRIDDTPLVGGMRVILNDKHWIDATSNSQQQIIVYVQDILRSLGQSDKEVVYDAKQLAKIGKKKTPIKPIIISATFLLVVGLSLLFWLKNNYKIETGELTQDDVNLIDTISNNIDTILNPVTPLPARQDTAKNVRKTIPIEMVRMSGGTFTMGSGSEQFPAHEVTLNSFSIGKYEVTQKIWTMVMGENPSFNKSDEMLPVENVSYVDIQEFIKKLNQLTGKRYRLPTEAEWEYAATDNNIAIAWYSANSGGKTHLVGKKNSNKNGLSDMLGNVSEWCSDWYGKYSISSQTNPKGAASGNYKVIRGGAWDSESEHCTSFYRNSGVPEYKSDNLGFRLAL